jgi:hypothetical protein
VSSEAIGRATARASGRAPARDAGGTSRRGVRVALAVLSASAVGGVGLGACSAGPERGGAQAQPLLPVATTTLATSASTSTGTWATLPMGHLDQASNTFWQLFYRPLGKTAWANEVEATATATNGGLVLAPAGPELTVGIRPSADLSFSPLISTSNGGRSWSNGLVAEGLALRPSALAVSAGGHAVALPAGHPPGTVLTSMGDLSRWRRLAKVAAVPAGRACDLTATTAVSFLAGEPLVGGTCARAGRVALFAWDGRAWRTAGLSLPGSVAHQRAEVLSLTQTGATTTALLATAGRAGTSLVAARSTSPGHWATSPALRLRHGRALASFGPAAGPGTFVLSHTSRGGQELDVWDGHGPWARLPTPPPHTATVAFSPRAPLTALAATATVMTVWTLRTSARGWARAQVVHVPIQYGSSS